MTIIASTTSLSKPIDKIKQGDAVHHLASSFSDNFAIIDFNTAAVTKLDLSADTDLPDIKPTMHTMYPILKQWVDPDLPGWASSGFKVTIFFPNASEGENAFGLYPDRIPKVYWPCYYQNQPLKINQIPAGSMITFILLLNNKNNEGSYNPGWHVVGSLPQATNTTAEYYTKSESDAKFASVNNPTIINPAIVGTLTINTDS